MLEFESGTKRNHARTKHFSLFPVACGSLRIISYKISLSWMTSQVFVILSRSMMYSIFICALPISLGIRHVWLLSCGMMLIQRETCTKYIMET